MRRLPPGTGFVAVLLALGLVASAVAQEPAGVAVDETDAYKNAQGPLYHTSNDIYSILSKLANVGEFSIIDTVSKKGHRAFRVVNKATGPSKGAAQQLPTVFIMCNQHARELVTAEVCMWLVRLLAGDIKTLLQWPEFASAGRGALLTGKGREKIGNKMSVPRLKNWISSLTSKFSFEVVPVVNIEGRDFIAATGAFGQRKNLDQPQVDLNRNWPVNRAQPGSGANELDPTGDEYQGATSLSEWETRSLYNYLSTQLDAKQRALFIDVHSGMWAQMAPWGGKFYLQDIPREFIDKTQRIFDQMRAAFVDAHAAIPNLRGVATGPGSGMSYASEGSVDDTAYKALGFSNVLTVEVYGPKDMVDSGWAYDCPTYAQFQAVCTDDNLCGTTVCRNMDGMLMTPVQGRRRDTASAAYLAAQQPEHQQLQQQPLGMASQPGATADAPFLVTPQAVPNIKQDPYMSLLSQANFNDVQMFKAFNPHTAALYREVVSRWLAGMLFAFEEVASQLQK